jgi:hypothetical protein
MRNALRPHSESHMRIADATDGRTNGTKNRIDVASNLKAVDAGARAGDPATIGEVLTGLVAAPTGRHEVIRTGERDEIPMHVRTAVYYRDRGRCELCGWLPVQGAWHLDHIKPWSAGGKDDTTNLRVLCERHNLERSNYHDMHERPRVAATWWCLNCYDRDDFQWRYHGPDNLPHCEFHGRGSDPIVNWKGCPVTRGYHQTFEHTGEWPTWHKRAGVVASAFVAFCAHCGRRGATDVAL